MKKRILSVALALCLCLPSQSVAYAYQENASQEEGVFAEESADEVDTSDNADTAAQEGASQEEDILTEETTNGSDSSDDADTAAQEGASQEEDVLTEETTNGPDSSDDTDIASQEDASQEAGVLTEETTFEQNNRDSDGNIPTPTEIYEAMIAFKDKEGYTEGTTWTDYEPYSDSNYYRWSGGVVNGTNIVAVGCVAFAFTLSDAAFGSLPNRMYAAGAFSYEDIKIGDILRVNGDTHTVIVLEVNEAGVVIAEGNNGGKVHWGRTISKDEVMSSTSHYITRYPEGYVSPDDPTANEIIGNGVDGGITWELTKAGTLTLSGSGAMPDYSGPEELPWNSYSSQIRKVIIGDGVTSIGSSAFYNCGVFSAEIASSVTTIGNNAFYGSSLISVTIPSSVKSIGESVFRACQNLSSVTFSEGLETIGQNTFRSCTSLTSIDLPASIGEVGAGVFYQCTAMTSATFEPGSKQVKLGDNLFTGCYYLMSVTLPSSIDKIGEGMFQNCSMLPGVIIPQGAESIETWAFASSGVEVVLIPDSVKSIGSAAFSACPLTDIYFTGTETQWNSISKIGDTASSVSKATIHYNYTPAPNPGPDDGDDSSGDDDDVTTIDGKLTANPQAGEVKAGTKVALTTGVEEGRIYYTVDGSAPTVEDGILYTEKTEIIINEKTTIKAIVVTYDADKETITGKSAVKTFIYTVRDDGVFVGAIPDQVYTGTDIKPDVAVYAVDGTLLSKGRDYTITYTKGAATKANIDKNGNPIEGVPQPYLTIKGKGNYETEPIEVKFNIVPASIGSADTFATGFTARINESIVLGNKPTAAVISLKYKKAMAIGTDYTVVIANKGEDVTKGVTTTADAKKLPAVNETGNYTVTITGQGNYCGTVTKTISASDKDHLLNSATVKLGSSLKKLQFASIGTGDGKIDMDSIASGEATTDAAKFTVSTRSDGILGTDQYSYKVIYANGSTTPAVGKAQLVITAKDGSDYYGSKSVAFTVAGTAAKKGVTIDTSTMKDVTYTGTAHTEYNNVEVRTISDKTRLVFEKDYTITYKNNIRKGTATMTFTMLPESGYTGSIKATFKITAATITTGLIKNASDFTIGGETAAALKEAVRYSKAGVRPSDKISMSLDSEYVLQEGTDYTVVYKNNTAVSTNSATMTIKGKGNFTGSYVVTFDIKAASLKDLYDSGALAVTVISQAYRPEQTKDYAIKVKLTDSGKALSANKDYVLASATCDYNLVHSYMNGGARPEVKISGGANGCYTEEISVPLSFYEAGNKMTAQNVTIAFKDENGDEVKAYYCNGAQVTMDKYLFVYFTAADGSKTLLDKECYVATWGRNNTAGNKKGTVTITGQGKYGGSAKCTFRIEPLGLTTNVSTSAHDVFKILLKLNQRTD